MKQRIADYIADFLVKNGIDTVFSVVGGGAMHLNDAFGKHEKLNVIHNHHEQASAMAAEGYARINGKMATVCVTTGPGGTNAITGVLGAWQDNVPMLVISGQVRYATTIEASGLNLRQMGEQEYCIVKSVSPMTKYAYMIKDVSEVPYVLEKAIYLATHGRPGPVWIDIPLNIQGAEVDLAGFEHFKAVGERHDVKNITSKIIEKLRMAKSPLLLAGAGIRRGDAYKEFRMVAEKLRIPIVSPTCVADILPLSYRYYYSNFGIVGGRTGNFLVQNADVIVSLGCRLSLNQIGFNYKEFAPQAYKIVVDIDSEELKKPTVDIDFPVHCDIKLLLAEMNDALRNPLAEKISWLRYADRLKDKFSLMKQVKNSPHGVNPYVMAHKLMEVLPNDGVVVVGNSSGSAFALHHGVMKDGQRLFGNINCGSMGWDLPAALGAAVANKSMVVCLTGDGSIQMNLQELQTVVLNRIPVKIFIYNNNGYMGIVRTQKNYFNGRLTGCTAESGLNCPDWEKIAYAYGFPFMRIENQSELEQKMYDFLNMSGFGICEIIEDSNQGPAFKTTSKKMPNGEIVSAPLDELAPLLSKDEFIKYRYFGVAENYDN